VNSFITGSTGFIGQKLVSAINGEVRVLSRKKHPDFETIICDVEKDSIPPKALDGIDTVFHLAACTHDVADVSKIESLYQKVNVDATIELAKLAAKSGVKKFVFVSSVKAGGSATPKVCLSENDQGDPEGIYGRTKREAELKLLKIGEEFDMHVSIIRPSLVYGPGVKGNLKLMVSGIKKGWFPPLPETGNRRSMIHVDDLVRAILLVSEDKRSNGEVFIATNGVPYSSRDIYNAMCGLTGKSIPKWSVPKTLFYIVSLLSPQIKYKINKLLGDEYYSSAKLEALGFKSKKSLKDINETDF
jgi:UDP-glucose 4-epimerase